MNKKGFTLVEILAVVAILSILVVLTVPNVLKSFNNAKKDNFLNEVREIYKEAKREYVLDRIKGTNCYMYGEVYSDSCNSKELDVSSRDGFSYYVLFDDNQQIIEFRVKDNNYEYSPAIGENIIELSNITIDRIHERNTGEVQRR